MPPSGRITRRRLIAFVAVAAATGSIVAGLTLPSIMDPVDGGRVASDAVFVHVGGRGERLDESLSLIEDGIADVLVIPTRPTGEWPEALELCQSDAPFEVVCLSSVPANTEEEAMVLAELASARSWDRVTVVTSDYHSARATMLDRSCTSTEVVPVPVEPTSLSPIEHAWKIAHEVVAIPYSWLLQRCDR